MKKALIGRKIKMSQYIQEDGTSIPVTICELGPCQVVQKKTSEKDGYNALKIGYLETKENRLSKALSEDMKKNGVSFKKVLREVDAFDETLEIGSVVNCSIFAENDEVQVTGISKGRGFAGVIKRYGFKGGKMTHGSHFHRSPGSVGACAYPGEIWKGKKMPGRHGTKKVTVKNLKIVKIFEDKNVVLISGAVPGTRNSLITVREK